MTDLRSALAGAVLSVALALPIAAAAQQAPPPPDKSGFTLFDPTPTADLRPFCVDRPTKSTSPCTVDAGHVQIETDLADVTYDRSGGATMTTWLIADPTLKLGLANTLDVELSIAPVEIVTVRDRATGRSSRQSGVGDLFARLKWSLIGDDGGAVGFALVPYIKAPTASAGLGDGAVEGGLIAPLSVNLPMNVQLVTDPEVDLVRDAVGGGHHVNTSGLIGLSRPISKAVTLSVELWSDIDFDPAGRTTQVSADLGAAWIPPSRPNIQFDGGVNLGLNNRTPGLQAYVGVSRRF